MAITGTVDLGNGVVAATVDADPTTNNPGLPAGSLVIWSGNIYRQPTSGAPTVVLSLHASSHGNGQADAVSLDAGQIGSGTLPLGRGGTGQTAKTAAFDGLAPSTTKGDLIVHNGTNNVRVGVGTTNQVLVADNGQAAGVKWASAPAGSLSMQEQEMAGAIITTDSNASPAETALTSNSSTYQVATRMTTAVLTGTFWIIFSAELNNDTASAAFMARCQNTTNNTVLGECYYTNPSNGTNAAAGWVCFTGRAEVTFTGAAKTFELQFKRITGSSTAGMRRARIMLIQKV